MQSHSYRVFTKVLIPFKSMTFLWVYDCFGTWDLLSSRSVSSSVSDQSRVPHTARKGGFFWFFLNPIQCAPQAPRLRLHVGAEECTNNLPRNSGGDRGHRDPKVMPLSLYSLGGIFAGSGTLNTRMNSETGGAILMHGSNRRYQPALICAGSSGLACAFPIAAISRVLDMATFVSCAYSTRGGLFGCCMHLIPGGVPFC